MENRDAMADVITLDAYDTQTMRKYMQCLNSVRMAYQEEVKSI